ncbi:uncharacterized protein LOC144158299 isoform X1 [Haemaphysalis longicornis]
MTKWISSQKRKATLPESECSSDSDNDDEVVPKKLLRKAYAHVRDLEEKLQVSESRWLEEVKKNKGLQDRLEEQTSLGTRMSSLEASVNQALLALNRAATPALRFEPRPEEAPPKPSHISCSPVHTGPGCATSSDQKQQLPTTMLTAAQVKLSVQPEEPPAATAGSHLQAAPATEPLGPGNTEKLFAVNNGKIAVAAGFSISVDRWERLSKAKSDSQFVRDTVRTFWKPEALKDRSVTGKPCNAKLKTGAQGKKELTPEKLAAVRSAYGYFVRHRSSGAPENKRLKAFNGYVANLLRDVK